MASNDTTFPERVCRCSLHTERPGKALILRDITTTEIPRYDKKYFFFLPFLFSAAKWKKYKSRLFHACVLHIFVFFRSPRQ